MYRSFYLVVVMSFIYLGMGSGKLYSQAVVGVPNQFESTWRLKQVIRDHLNKDEKSNPIAFEDIKGSPYHNNSFALAKLIIQDSVYGNYLMRFNIYNDEIEILESNEGNLKNPKDEDIFALLKIPQTEVIFDDATVKLKTIQDEGEANNSYVIEVHNGEAYSLYLKKSCVLTPAEKAATPNQSDRAARFNIYDNYFLYDHDKNEMIEFSLKKSDIKKAFPENSQEIIKFIKKERIKKKDERSLITFLKYLNELS